MVWIGYWFVRVLHSRTARPTSTDPGNAHAPGASTDVRACTSSFAQMLVFTCFIFPLIMPAIMPSGGMATGEAIETLIALGPFLHCVLMPFFWYRTHRRSEKTAAEEPPKTPELDPDAKTVIFSMKLKLLDKLTVRASSHQIDRPHVRCVRSVHPFSSRLCRSSSLG